MVKKIIVTIVLVLVALLLAPAKASALEAPHLSATYKGGDSAWLSWTPVAGANKYQILYGPKTNPWVHGVVLGEGGLDVTSGYSVKGLFRNTSYVFTVKATRNGEVSMTSNWVWVTTGPTGRAPLPAGAVGSMPGKPTMPSMVWATPGTVRGNVTVYWNEMPDGAYNIVYTDDLSVEKWGVIDISSSARSYTIYGLTPGKTYYVWMSTRTSKQTNWVKVVAR